MLTLSTSPACTGGLLLIHTYAPIARTTKTKAPTAGNHGLLVIFSPLILIRSLLRVPKASPAIRPQTARPAACSLHHPSPATHAAVAPRHNAFFQDGSCGANPC